MVKQMLIFILLILPELCHYVTNEAVQSITLKIFNLAGVGVPIGIVRQDGSN